MQPVPASPDVSAILFKILLFAVIIIYLAAFRSMIPYKKKKKETGNMAFHITEAALKRIKEIIESKDGIGIKSGVANSTTFLRIGITGGGCSGLSYLLKWDSQPEANDKTFEFHLPDSVECDPKLKIAIDPKSYLYLNGATLDYVEQELTGGFAFINPNAQSSCGCGQSFHA